MFEKLKKFLKIKKQKGQSMIFVAAAAPILCAFVGAAMDFGWMYYQQSRLQNAADAAASAGARTLVGGLKLPDMPLSDYSYTTLVANTDSGLQSMISQNIVSTRVKDGTSASKTNGKYAPAGDRVAVKYVEEHLSSELNPVTVVTSDDVGIDSTGSGKVKFQSVLYGGSDNEDYEALYYTVTLSTELDHLFGGIMETFGIGKMPAQAMAAAKISHVATDRTNIEVDSEYPHGPSLYQQMKAKEQSEVYPHWEEMGHVGLNGNDRSILTPGSDYITGNFYRTESMDLNGYGTNTGSRSYHNYGNDQRSWDDLFIDFEPDIGSKLTANGDFDLAYGASTNWQYGDSNSNKKYYRIHYPIRISGVYPVRSNKQPPDTLYAFIEQEAIIQTITYMDGSTGSRNNMNTVHQIIISNQADNSDTANRPWVFFYEGPEIPSKATQPDLYDSDGDYIGVRPFLPVILNLTENFRGILFMPNNPVVINGNGKIFEGFVVAREFRRLKTAADFEDEGYIAVDDADDTDQTYIISSEYFNTLTPYSEFAIPSSAIGISYNGNQYYVYQDDFKTSPTTTDLAVTYNGKTYYISKSVTLYTQNNTRRTRKKVTYNGGTYYIDSTDYLHTSPSTTDISYTYGNTTWYISPNALHLIQQQDTSGTKVVRGENTYYIDPAKILFTSVTSEKFTVDGARVDLPLNKMFIYTGNDNDKDKNGNDSHTKAYTETYINVNGKQKTKTSYMSAGDVQYVNITAGTATSESADDKTQSYNDDQYRFDYTTVFNLHEDSKYNSFLNVGLVNYTYLAKNESGKNSSHDMFFTTARSKHID